MRTRRAALLLTAAKGFVMGAADVVPGVSGGTMAFILGIYRRLLAAISAFDVALARIVLRGRLGEAAGSGRPRVPGRARARHRRRARLLHPHRAAAPAHPHPPGAGLRAVLRADPGLDLGAGAGPGAGPRARPLVDRARHRVRPRGRQPRAGQHAGRGLVRVPERHARDQRDAAPGDLRARSSCC